MSTISTSTTSNKLLEHLASHAFQYEADCMDQWSSGGALNFGDALTCIDLYRNALELAIKLLDEVTDNG